VTINKNHFLWLSLFIILANVFSGALGYLYQIIIGRLLEPSEFVKFSAIISLLVLFNSPLTTLLTVASKEVAHLKALNQTGNIQYLFNSARRLSLFNIIPLALLYALASSYLMEYLKLENTKDIALLFLLLFVSPFCFINHGFLQGIQSFKWYTVVTISEVLLKIAICSTLIFLGFGLVGALGGVLIAMFISQLLSTVPINSELRQSPKLTDKIQRPNWLKNYSKYWPLLIGNIALVIITQLDILYVNWFFPISESSIYAVSATLGKTILYLPAGIVTAALPMFATKHAKNEASKPLLIQSLWLSFALCASLTIFFWIFQENLIPLLFGNRYIGQENMLGWYSLSMIPISLVMVIESSIIAKGKIFFSWLYIIFVPIQILSITYLHTTPLSVIYILGLTGLCILVVGVSILYFLNGKSKNV
jgi:O-antigen/teichoic acid export membrane protein